jgi:16S rRNA (uracil1498-N3)-methyltransferase
MTRSPARGEANVRLFVAGDLAAGVPVTLADGQAHYLARVMRLRAGDAIRVFNGRDGEWLARIGGMERARPAVAVERLLRPQGLESGPWLVFAPVKKSPTDYVVEKATELGVEVVRPVLTERTIVDRVNAGRLRARAIEAAEQCERLTVPDVLPAAHLAELVAAWPRERPLLVAHPCAPEQAQSLLDVLASLASPAAASPPPAAGFLIGPEGGLSHRDLDILAALPCAKVVRLGARTLRAETAAAAVLACWQAVVGDWRGGGFPPAT